MRADSATLAAVVLAVVLAGALAAVPAAAQVPNPFQAAKDAFKHAMQQARQQLPQQQGQVQGLPSAPAPQTAGAAVPGEREAAPPLDCCSTQAMRKYATDAASLNMVGLKLGMTVEQAVAAIKAYNPAMQVEVLYGRLERPSASKYDRVPRFVSGYTRRSPNSGYETITAELTTPPSAPVVDIVERSVDMPPGQPVRASNLGDNFTRKYGPSNFQSPQGMAWVYDQNHQPMTRLSNVQATCLGEKRELPVGTGEPNRDNYGYYRLNLTVLNNMINQVQNLSAACLALNWVSVEPLGMIAPDQPVIRMVAVMASGALWYGSRRATYEWLQADAAAARKRADDAAAHQAGPQL
ncbi:MAG: hypothetical protein JSR67_14400 [Proteobacteria bacterium]|nr:hypothetical protein [Pseudomonadota bacterium]